MCASTCGHNVLLMKLVMGLNIVRWLSRLLHEYTPLVANNFVGGKCYVVVKAPLFVQIIVHVK